MSRKHENLLRAIFQDPVGGNIQWREVESLLHHLGATTEPLAKARLRVKLNGVEGTLHRPHVAFPDQFPAHIRPVSDQDDVKIPLDPNNWTIITDAMANVVSPIGTANSAPALTFAVVRSSWANSSSDEDEGTGSSPVYPLVSSVSSGASSSASSRPASR